MLTAEQVTTQKARGVLALERYNYNVPDTRVFSAAEFLRTTEPDDLPLFPSRFLPDKIDAFLTGRFVRPCPLVPRHGFVDSRPINTIEDAERLLAETLAAEPRAELLTMPVIDAKLSAIWTPGQLVIGTGNDGATAGHTSRSIPISGDALGARSEDVRAAAGITESPYVELLWNTLGEDIADRPTFVQLRNGPVLPRESDYVPEKVTVAAVEIAGGDLLDWETKVKTFAPGTVVSHVGGSLASHYAVHCVLNKVPILTTREPQLGEVLEPAGNVREPRIDKIKAGFVLGCTRPMRKSRAAFAMLAGCHSTADWLGRRDVLLGFAMGCCYRLVVTAVLGEMRHSPGRKRKPSRHFVYEKCWDRILSAGVRTQLIRALKSFDTANWRSGYGGKAWLHFANGAREIFNALHADDVTKALETLNKTVNMAHNTGWGFDKFLERHNLDEAASSPVTAALRSASELFDALQEYDARPELLSWWKKRQPIPFTSASAIELDEDCDVAEADAQEQEENADEDAHEVSVDGFCPDCGNEIACDCGVCHDCEDGENIAVAEEGEAAPSPETIAASKGSPIEKLQVKKSTVGTGSLHVQYVCEVMPKGMTYHTANVHNLPELTAALNELTSEPTVPSLSPGSTSKYIAFSPGLSAYVWRAGSFWLYFNPLKVNV